MYTPVGIDPLVCFEGPGDAPLPPLSSSTSQSDTLVPPCVPQYSHYTVPSTAMCPTVLPPYCPQYRHASPSTPTILSPVPPCVPHYSDHTDPQAREWPLYPPELVLGPGDASAPSLISSRGPRAVPMPPRLHPSSPAGCTSHNTRRRGCCCGPTRCPFCRATPS